MTKTFILSDNSLNRHGYRVMTDGINLDNYKKNPVVLFAHMRSGEHYGHNLPIGTMSNIRVQGEQLLGDVNFDMSDEFAAKIAGKVERGVLNSVSIGIREVSYTEDATLMLPGQKYPTITAAELYEVSVVDIPANANAVSLSDDNYVLHLGYGNPKDLDKIFNQTPKIKMELTLLTFELNKVDGVKLSEQATLAEVAGTVAKVVAANLTLKADADKATAKVAELEAAQLTLKAEALKEKATTLVDTALSLKKITADQKAHYLALASKDDDTYGTVKGILDGMTGYVSVQDQLAAHAGKGNTVEAALLALSWDEALKQNKLTAIKEKHYEHYEALFESKFNRKPTKD